MRTKFIFAAATFLFCLCTIICSGALGDVPRTITFQGRLSDMDGKPIADGYYGIRFRIYDVETGGTPLWEKLKGVNLISGMFEAILGEETPIDLPFDRQYWIGIKIATNEEETSPRIKLTASAYAMNSARVSGYPASATPAPNTLLPLDDTGMFPAEVIPAVSDADKVDGFDASSTPTPDTLLPLDSEGKFPSEVIPQVSDADTVDGFDASATATANTLLACDENAKLPASITGDAGTVDGLDATTTAQAGKLLALDQNAKLPASITGDANTVGGFHAAASPAANNLLPLNASSKFPNSVLYTGSGNGLDADMLDSKHATDFVGKTGTQTISGATTAYDGVLTVTNTSTGVAVKGVGNSGGIGVRGEGTQFGVYGYSDDGYGGRFQGKSDGSGLALYVKGSSYFTGYATFSGGKSGYVVDICRCADPEGLSSGDVVVIVGASEPVIGDIPTMDVKKADSEAASGIVGVVDRRCDGESFHDDPIRAGDLLSVVTLGAYRWVNADAADGPIRPGDLLTSSATPGFAKKATPAVAGAAVGKALDPLESGRGRIRVFVSPQ
jgi:hypothetical protein